MLNLTGYLFHRGSRVSESIQMREGCIRSKDTALTTDAVLLMVDEEPYKMVPIGEVTITPEEELTVKFDFIN